MNIKGLQQQLRDFAAAREWQSFHSPKNLAMALMVEAAELLELFQWLTTEQSHTLTRDAGDKEKVADEMADVMLYLLQMADRTGVDLDEAVQQKMRKNALKHPPKWPEGGETKQKVHLLVDWENVQPEGDALKQLVPEGTDIWLFHAPAQRVNFEKHEKAYGADSVTLVARTGTGKNALDFQLSYYAGYLMARQPDARFVVVSNDKGYDPMLAHACTLKFQAQRCAYQKPAAPKDAVPATTSKPKPAAKKKPAAAVAPVPAQIPLPPLPSSTPSVAQIACRMRTALLELPPPQRPVNWSALVHMAQALLAAPVNAPTGLAEQACRLLQIRGTVRRDMATGVLQYPIGEGAAAHAPVPPSQLPLMSGVCRTPESLKSPLPTQELDIPAPIPAQQKKKGLAEVPNVDTAMPSVALLQAPKSAKPLQRKAAAVPATSAQEPLTKPAAQNAQKPVQSVKKMVQHMAHKVQASLQKMTGNRPAHRDGLLKIIQTHLSSKLPSTVTASQVCAVLQSMQLVKISRQSEVTYPRAAHPARKRPKVTALTSKPQAAPHQPRARVPKKAAPAVRTAAAQ